MTNELILIVEDNEKNRRLLRDVLQVNGYQTLESETAEEGIEIARQSQPALVLMDIQLPGISGIQAFQQLQAEEATRGIPVIAVTASAMQEERAQIETAGFAGYQPKPIQVMEFVKAVDGIVGGRDADT